MSAVSEAGRVSTGYEGFSSESAEKETPSVAVPSHQSPEDEKYALRFQECLRGALYPDVQKFPRDEVLKIQLAVIKTDSERFPLLLELFKMKIEEMKKNGLTSEEYLAELKTRLTNHPNRLFDGENSAIKNELAILAHVTYECAKRSSGINAHFKLFELEKETGFALEGLDNLVHQVENDVTTLLHVKMQLDVQKLAHYSVLIGALTGKDISLSLENLQSLPTASLPKNIKTSSDFYGKVVLPNSQKAIDQLEKVGDKARIEKIFKLSVKCFSVVPVHLGLDPLIQLLPYIAKYGSLEDDDIKKYFNKHFSELTPHERAYKWIDLHCQAVEILIPTDLAKAQSYLKIAETLAQDKIFSPSFFSFNRSAILQKQREALARIDEAKAKLH